MQLLTYETKGGVRVHREIAVQPYSPADSTLAERLDDRRGVLFSSSFEFPGRYTRWDMGFVDPPLVLTARGREFTIEALNQRGAVLLPAIGEHLAGLDAVRVRHSGADRIDGRDPGKQRAFSGGTAQPPAFGLFGPAVARRVVRQPGGRASRAVWRVRLRSRLSVRADDAETGAARRSARPGAVSARRDADRRSHAAAIADPPL